MSYTISNRRLHLSGERLRLPWPLLLALCAFAVHATVWRLFGSTLVGDELRYFHQALKILDGVPLYPDGVVKNPPLFPVFLAALLKLGVSASNLKLASVFATTLASVLLFSLLARFTSTVWAFSLSCLFFLYPPTLMLGSQIMTEPFAALLLLLACRLLLDIRDFRDPGIPRLCALSLVLATLALLKPIFGYALAAVFCLAVAMYVLGAWRLREFHRWSAGVALLSIALCVPYLAYIHTLTGSLFSWGTTGGEHFYWMSIGGEDIWGNWVAADEIGDIEFLVDGGYAAEVGAAETMRGPDAQRYYARIALERVRQNPLHFARNVLANTGRVLFNYPYSFRPQSLYTYAYLLPNMVLYLCLALSVALLPLTRREQHPGLAGVMLFGLIYLGGNMLVGSTGRQGVVLVGPILLWLAFQARLLLDAGIVRPPGRTEALPSEEADPPAR